MDETKKGFLQLHLSVLLAGFTGLFGRLITLNEVDIVWYRMLFTTCILLVFTGLPRVGWRKFLQLCGCGALLGIHWMLFYGSIKASNVSIGVICFSLIGFFTALFEPLIFKRRLSWVELLFSLITVAGVLCIFSLDARYRYGIMIGIASSAVCALYAICNKKVSVGIRSRTVLMYQMSGGLVIVSAVIPLYLLCFPGQQPVVVVPEGTNLWFMLCHALFCTVGMYLLQIQALKRLSAFTVNLTYNLEPCSPSSWLSSSSARGVRSTSPSISALRSSCSVSSCRPQGYGKSEGLLNHARHSKRICLFLWQYQEKFLPLHPLKAKGRLAE